MGVQTLVHLVIVLAVFCIQLSEGLKCYQCDSVIDGGGCHKPEESFLKECTGALGARADPEGASKPGCLEVLVKAGDAATTSRKCWKSSKPAGCDDAGAGGMPTVSPQARLGDAGGKSCICYEDGCNKTQAGSTIAVSIIGIAAALLLNLFI